MAWLRFLIISLATLSVLTATAQPQTVGTFLNTDNSFDGYTLFAPMSSTTTYLINNCGEVVQSWNSDHRPGLGAYLLPNGDLLRTAILNNSTFTNGGSGGGIQIFDWDGNLTWDYQISSTLECQHHDVEYLPNGNVLIIVWELKTAAEAIAQGRDPSLLGTELWPDKIVEVSPDGPSTGAVVWEWHAWDHLIQDFDPTKPNYGVVAEHPELIDLNFPASSSKDWLHTNSVDYNPELDQIVLSSHNTHELWIIDHSTTTAEAAGHTGGNSGKGGDLLYRWGNPQAYGAGTQLDKEFYGQHDARWITEGSDIGKLMVFNNGQNRSPGLSYSSIDIIEAPVDVQGNYTTPSNGNAFLPNALYWSYVADPTTSFYSSNISGAHRLPNDNTLICEGSSGHLFEVSPTGELVWDYRSPVSNSGPVEQGSTPGGGISVFRCSRYASKYEAFTGRDLTPGDVIELNSTVSCELFPEPTDIHSAEFESGFDFILDGNSKVLTISNIQRGGLFRVYNSLGSLVTEQAISREQLSISIDRWPVGIYFIVNDHETGRIVKKILIR